MEWSIPEELRSLKEKTKQFVLKVEPLTGQVSQTGIVPPALIEEMGRLGFFGLTIPREYGGLGLGLFGYCYILEELSKAHACFGGLVALNNMVGSRVILYGGTEEQKKTLLPDIASGKAVAAFALTEPEAGSDAAAIQTSAVPAGNDYVINGKKHLIMHGPIGDIFTVITKTDPALGARGGITAFWIKKGTPGFSPGLTQQPMAKRTTVSELIFEQCRVSKSQVIGPVGQGFSLAMKALDDTRLGVGGYCLGIAERLLDLSIRHLQNRKQFGKPLGAFQVNQFTLAEMATDIAAAQHMIYQIARKGDEGLDISVDSAMAKLFVSEMVCRVADKALQLHGGLAYLEDHPVNQMYRDARIWRIVDGTSEVQKLVISRKLLQEDSRN